VSFSVLTFDVRIGTFNDLNPPTPTFPSSPHTTFGSNQNVPFIFHSPTPKTPRIHDWTPPPNFSPSKAFPSVLPFQPETNDVDMVEISPPKAEVKEGEGGRAVAFGGMRRVFRARQKARGSQNAVTPSREGREGDTSESESGDEEGNMLSRPTQNLSHHYTLNMSTAPTSHSDMPYILLGYATCQIWRTAALILFHSYLQFFFNLSLILLFLYLALQFILTVQRDVEKRISEYSMGSHLFRSFTFSFTFTNFGMTEQKLCKKSLCVPFNTRTTYVHLILFPRWPSNAVAGRHACNEIPLSLAVLELVPSSSQKSSIVSSSPSVGKLW
jgi:hypothetical protein